MLDYINNFLESQLQWLNVPYFGISDIFEIVIIAFTVYFVAKSLANTRIWAVVKGMVYLLIAYGVFVLCNLQVIAQIFLILIALCLVGVVLALQPEIKKLLAQTGSKDYVKRFFAFLKKDKKTPLTFSDKTVDALVDACENMQDTKTGALIVFELDTPLEDIIATGQRMDAIVQKALLLQTFVKDTPLHDGAMVIKNDRIDSATCYLPLSENTKISKDLGTRHRAGIGVTEQVDCFVLIVQEETGAISWAENGKLRHKVSLKELRQKLMEIQHRKDVNYKKSTKKNKNKSEKIKDGIRKGLLSNMLEKILTLICACLIWVTVTNFINPNVTRRFSDIKVTTLNTDVLSTSEQTYDIVSGTETSIIVRGRRQIVDSLRSSDITATADFNNINAAYAIPIDVQISEKYSEDIEISYQSVKSMKLELDDVAETLLDINYEVLGQSADGAYVSSVQADIDQIQISGANKLISTIDKVVLEVDVTNASRQFSTTVEPKVYDRNGTLIDNSRLSFSKDKIKVDVEILKTKKVPVQISVVNDNENIRIVSADYDVKEVQLAGQTDELSKVDELNIEVDVQSDLKQLQQNKFVKVVDLSEYLNSEVSITGNQKINLSIDVERQTETTFTLNASQIQMQNLRDGYTATIDSSKTYNISIVGFESDMKDLTVQQIAPYIDLSGLRSGSYTLQLNINPTNSDSSITIKSSDAVEVELNRLS